MRRLVHSKLLINQRTFVMHTPEHRLKICHSQTPKNLRVRLDVVVVAVIIAVVVPVAQAPLER